MRAACHNSYAGILGRDQFELAKVHYKQAIELRRRPDVLAIPGMRIRLAQSVENLGVIHWKERDYPQAEQRFRQAEELLLAPKRYAPGPDRETTITLAQVDVNWVGLFWETKKHDQAIARATSAIKALEPYVANRAQRPGCPRFSPQALRESERIHFGRLGEAERPPRIGQRSSSLHPSPCRHNIESLLALSS